MNYLAGSRGFAKDGSNFSCIAEFPNGISSRMAMALLLPACPADQQVTLFEKDADLKIRPASLVKLVSAAAVIRISAQMKVSWNFPVTILDKDVARGSGNNLEPGDLLSLWDALANILLASSNVTANAVARATGSLLLHAEAKKGDPKERFVNEMNGVARSLGMTSSHFVNPHGLPSRRQFSTARDLVKVMAAISQVGPVMSLLAARQHTALIRGPRLRWQKIASTVKGRGDSSIIGGKTGTVLPRDFHLAMFSRAPNEGLIATVLLEADDRQSRYEDLKAMLATVHEFYDWSEGTPKAKP